MEQSESCVFTLDAGQKIPGCHFDLQYSSLVLGKKCKAQDSNYLIFFVNVNIKKQAAIIIGNYTNLIYKRLARLKTFLNLSL